MNAARDRLLSQGDCCPSVPAVLHYPTPSYLPGPHPTLRSFYHSTLSYLSLPRYNHILPAPTLDPPASLPYPTPYNHILPRPTLDPPAILPCPTQSYLADYHPTQSYLIQPHPTLDSSTILPCPTLFLPHITLCTPHPAMEFITHPTPTTHPGDSFKTIHLRKRKTCDVFEHPG